MSNFSKNFETEIVNYDRGDILANIVPILDKISSEPILKGFILDSGVEYSVKDLFGLDLAKNIRIVNTAQGAAPLTITLISKTNVTYVDGTGSFPSETYEFNLPFFEWVTLDDTEYIDLKGENLFTHFIILTPISLTAFLYPNIESSSGGASPEIIQIKNDIASLLLIEQKKRAFQNNAFASLAAGASITLTPPIDAKRITINGGGATAKLVVKVQLAGFARDVGIKNLLTGNIQPTITANGLYEVVLPRIATTVDTVAVQIVNSGTGSAFYTLTWCGE